MLHLNLPLGVTNEGREATSSLASPGNLRTTPGLGHRGSSRCGGLHPGSPAPGRQRLIAATVYTENKKGGEKQG